MADIQINFAFLHTFINIIQDVLIILMESSKLDQRRYRDIIIVYRNIEINHKVDKLEVVGQYFKNMFQQDLDHIFSQKAREKQINHYVELKNLKKYDVRLNSRDDGSVMNVTFDFGSYSSQKRLKFYVINLLNSSQFSQLKEYIKIETIEVVVMSTTKRSKVYKIKDLQILLMQQFIGKIIHDFELNKSVQLNFFNLFTNEQLIIENKQKIQVFMKKHQLSRLGVRQVHQAG